MSTSDGSTRKHSHYHKDVGHLLTMDVYRLCERFEINDPSGATQHAIKKLVCAGQRGSKGLLQDLQEAVDTISRRIEMIYEDQARDALLSTAFGQQNMIDQADVEIASAIDDDSERMQAIGPNGEMASEVSAAVDAMPNLPGVPEWSEAPEWAEWLAIDNNGEWYWYERQISADDMRGAWDYGSGLSGAIRSAAYSSDDGRPDWRSSLQPRPAK